MIASGYFNSIGGDRKYNAETMSKYYSGILSRGVLQNYKDELAVVANGAMTVKVLSGKAYFTDGKWVENTTAYNLTLGPADVTLSRIDRIVLREDRSEGTRSVNIIIKKGTPATIPVAPTLDNDEHVEEISLAAIYVAKLTETITQANISDERPINSVCGFVHGLINQIDTETLFLQYDAVFNNWFQNIKDALSSTTLIRQYTSHYTTTTQDQTEIPINISQYNSSLDILNVFINGLKLIRGVDYTQTPGDSSKVILTVGLDVNQLVDFEVFKSVDGSEAESVVEQVYQLQNSVNLLERYIYYTTGTDDNVKLSNLCQEYFAAVDAPDQITIEIIGNNFAMSENPISGAGSSVNRYKWFEIGNADTTRHLTLDFAKCSKITLANAMANSLIMIGRNVTIRNLKMEVQAGSAVTFTESQRSEYYDCDIKMKGSGAMCFARCCGTFANNRVEVISQDDTSYCFQGTGVNFLRVIGGTYYAYTGDSTKMSAAFYVAPGLDSNIILMTNCNCPFVSKTGYFQANAIKIDSGKYALSGNIVGEAASIATGATGNNTGEIVASIAL